MMHVAGQGMGRANTAGLDDNPDDLATSEALISLEFEIISPSTLPSEKPDKAVDNTEMRILNLQFNSLDFIGKPFCCCERYFCTGQCGCSDPCLMLV